MAWRAVFPMERLPAAMTRSVAAAWLGVKAHVVHYPLRNGRLFNFGATVERADRAVESWSTEGSHLESCSSGHWSAVRSFLNGPRAVSRCWGTPAIGPCSCWRRGP